MRVASSRLVEWYKISHILFELGYFPLKPISARRFLWKAVSGGYCYAISNYDLNTIVLFLK